MISFKYLSEIINLAEEKNEPVWKTALREQAACMETTEDEIFAKMKESLSVMIRSSKEGLKPGLKSISGLSGGDGLRMQEYYASGKALSGEFNARATAIALAIMEYNAAMGKIVAAPTAGSCGILPAGVITMMELHHVSEEAAVHALITAGAVGLVIATKATLAGAEGGCQAECGSAAAMTAAALVELSGGTPNMTANAVAIALQNLMGIVCDPVAGLVEVPCILRNACGINIAINSADMALAGIKSVIPVDEVITAMGEVGGALPASLRETALGGLAATPTGLAIKERIFGATS